MKVLTFALGQLQANCYFLIEGEECLIIDPADEGSFILEELQRRNLKLVGMLATHGHFDHVMAAGEIQKSINIPFYISSDDSFLIDRLEETAEYFLGYRPAVLKPISIKHLIEIRLQIGQFKFDILATPGHSPGAKCFYFPHFAEVSRGSEKGVIFTGDTLFKGGIGRYDFSYSSKKDLKTSLEKLLKLPIDTVVYPGHGESTTIKDEKDILKLYPL